MVELQVESYADVAEELKPLHAALWREKANDKDSIPLDMNYEAYDEYARKGALHLITVRDEEMLVGYHLSIIHHHLHYRSVLACFTDIFYLMPEYRIGFTGYRMLKLFRDSVRAKGVRLIYMGHSLSSNLSPILDRLGFDPIERTYKQVCHA